MIVNGLFSKAGKLTQELFFQPPRKRAKPKIATNYETDEESPEREEKVIIKQQIEPFAKSLSRDKATKKIDNVNSGFYQPKYSSVKKRTTHVLPFQAYKSRQAKRISLDTYTEMFIDKPKKKPLGFVDLSKQLPRPRCKTQLSEHNCSELKKNSKSVNFNHQSGHSLFSRLRTQESLYKPNYDFVFKKTVYVGIPFEQVLDRPPNIYKVTCQNPFQYHNYDQFNIEASSVFQNTKKSVPCFNQQLDRQPNPGLPFHMQKNIGSRLQLTCLNEKMLESNYSLQQ